MTLLDKIREKTSEIHKDLHFHPRMKQLLSDNHTTAQIADVLCYNYSYHKANNLTYVRDILCERAGYIFSPVQRWIAQDLRLFGRSSSMLSPCPYKIKLDSESAAWGVAYVIEGALLGGQVIAKKIEKNACIPITGMAYFSANTDDRKHNWSVFSAKLNERSDYVDHHIVLDTAFAAFEQYKRWISTDMCWEG